MKGGKTIMKNLRKLFILIPLSVSCYALAMVEGEKKELSIEDRLWALELKTKELAEELKSLKKAEAEGTEGATYEKCNLDGTECKKITTQKAATIIQKHKHHKVRRCHGASCRWVKGAGKPATATARPKYAGRRKHHGRKHH